MPAPPNCWNYQPQLALNDPNAEKRLQAVKSDVGKVADSDRAALIAHQQKETDAQGVSRL